MTMSPRWYGVSRPLRCDGKDRTLVGLSLLRQLRLSDRIAESSVSTIASSPADVDVARAASRMARRTVALTPLCVAHSGACTMMSMADAAKPDFAKPGLAKPGFVKPGLVKPGFAGARLIPWPRGIVLLPGHRPRRCAQPIRGGSHLL